MTRKSWAVESTAEAYLNLLAARGVEYLFANAGTDFAPIIEAMARCASVGSPTPSPILATHENLALAMAHGYAMVSGRVPAAMVHVSVGTANGACAVMNAARENVPVLFTAGRTPIHEEDCPGSRDSFIHWGQEMFDQAGLVREFVKWDYELRDGAQLEAVIDRALSVATTEPRGPVYLSLPREVLAAPLGDFTIAEPSRHVAAAPPRPDEAAIEAAAGILAAAEAPLVIAGNVGRDRSAVGELAAFAEAFAIPVVQYRARHLALPSEHPMHLGYDSAGLVGEADAILVLECDVPWIPKLSRLRPECRVVHVGVDPLFGRIPMRSFRCDLALTAGAGSALRDLGRAMAGRVDARKLERRRRAVDERREAARAELQRSLAKVKDLRPIHLAWISHCLAQAKGEEAIVVNEYGLMLEHCGFGRPGSYFGSSSASGLGWGMGAALGAKLAARDRLVVSVVGDGAYIFANPVAAHYASRQHDLPILTLVLNNAMWNAVRRATLTVYPEGWASKANAMSLVDLKELPAFEQICAAAGGYGERVEDPAELPAALGRAIDAVTREGRQALLNIICQAR